MKGPFISSSQHEESFYLNELFSNNAIRGVQSESSLAHLPSEEKIQMFAFCYVGLCLAIYYSYRKLFGKVD
jgi:hypothetical protein